MADSGIPVDGERIDAADVGGVAAHIAASAAVHGLAAAVNVFGSKQAAGLRKEYKRVACTFAAQVFITGITVTWDNAFTAILGAVACISDGYGSSHWIVVGGQSAPTTTGWTLAAIDIANTARTGTWYADCFAIGS